VKGFVSLQFLNLGHSVGLLGRLISPSQGRFFFPMALQPFLGPWPYISVSRSFYIDGRTPWTSDQPVARPLPIHRTTQT
jgi:hypothetical protein